MLKLVYGLSCKFNCVALGSSLPFWASGVCPLLLDCDPSVFKASMSSQAF